MLLELRKLGLKENEAKIYLAGLELGPVPLAALAQKAGIARPTAYEIAGVLKTRGLFSETRQNKKRVFMARSPESLLGILRVEKRELEEREREFLRTIGALEARHFQRSEGMIRHYRGKEGVRMLKEKIALASSTELALITGSAKRKEIAEHLSIYQKIRRRRGALLVRELYGLRPPAYSSDFLKRRVLPRLRSFTGTLFIFEKAAYLPAGGREGYLIENRHLLLLLSFLFEVLWGKTR